MHKFTAAGHRTFKMVEEGRLKSNKFSGNQEKNKLRFNFCMKFRYFPHSTF
jgi:hypothetical protein